MHIVSLYVSTALIFFALDALMLRFAIKPLFEAHIGSLMLDQPRMLPALGFYLAYVAAVVYLVSFAALRHGDPLQALVGGAVLGFAAYGTYEFTSFAIMRDWNFRMVLVDVAWGTVLTAISASLGVWLVRIFQ